MWLTEEELEGTRRLSILQGGAPRMMGYPVQVVQIIFANLLSLQVKDPSNVRSIPPSDCALRATRRR